MRKIHESFALKKRDKTPPGRFGFLGWLRNLFKWFRPSLHTMQWSHRETNSLIKTLAHLGVVHEKWPFSDLSSHGGLRLLEAESETHKTSWNNPGVTPGEFKQHTSSKWVHYTSSLVSFIPDKFNLKWETEFLKKRNKGVSDQPLTNTPSRFTSNTHGAHICKYLVNWRNYTKRDLNLKWPNWGSFDIPKLIFFFCVHNLERSVCLLWLVSRSF